MEDANSAPTGCYKCGRTGCYKCGRPGHWARDCPDAPKFDQPNLNAFSSGANFTPNQLPRSEKPKKVPKSRTRPKLTPELLLSDDGFGYILCHFPRAFRYRGRGHEFVHKADKVASSKRVKNCIRDLRERVARGGDPTKLHESPDEFNGPSDEQGARHSDGQIHHDHYEGDMLNEIYQKASEEPSHDIQNDIGAGEVLAASSSGPEHQVRNNGASCSSEVHITEEQRARMEANKSKALERAAAGSSSDQITEEQHARMEANRLKALERAAARAHSLQ
ncbi:hypothetical protein CRYUN_Cryun21dG0029500 [Craigia yunnanensis]